MQYRLVNAGLYVRSRPRAEKTRHTIAILFVRRRCLNLLYESVKVIDNPSFHYLAAFDPINCDALERNWCACCCHSIEFALLLCPLRRSSHQPHIVYRGKQRALRHRSPKTRQALCGHPLADVRSLACWHPRNVALSAITTNIRTRNIAGPPVILVIASFQTAYSPYTHKIAT